MNIEVARDVIGIMIRSYMDRDVDVERDVLFPTMVHPLPLDFLLSFGPANTGLRCYGKDHEEDPSAHALPEWEAAALLGSGIQVLYDVRPEDVDRDAYDVMYVVARFNPELFTEFGLQTLYSESSEAARRYDFTNRQMYERVSFDYRDTLDDEGLPQFLRVYRYDVANKPRAFWSTLLKDIHTFGDHDFSTLDHKREQRAEKKRRAETPFLYE